MRLIRLTDLSHPLALPYCALTEAQLRNGLNPSDGLFIAESPKVIRTALQAGYEPVSMLCEEKHIEGDAAEVIGMAGDIDVLTGSRELLRSLTGYRLTRGVLCAMRRPGLPAVESVCSGARRLVIIDGVCDTTNIGAIFRAAAALGIDGALLTPTSCDPLNRRAVRVSMGSVFLLPWTYLDGPVDSVNEYGFRTVAMALRSDSIRLDDPVLRREPRLAIVMGTEGDGLAQSVIDRADYTVMIPMAHGVDSLNVASAAAVAFWELTKH